jgi:hypothetical protein
MKTIASVALSIVLVAAPAYADDLQNAHAAITRLLQKDGGGLVSPRSACPNRNADPWEFADTSNVVSITDTDKAVLVDTHQCAGGNKHGQYLVVIQNSVAQVVTDAEIDDMSFLANNMRVEGTTLALEGYRWLNQDPHCCPSKRAILQYDVKTHQHRFIITGDSKS